MFLQLQLQSIRFFLLYFTKHRMRVGIRLIFIVLFFLTIQTYGQNVKVRKVVSKDSVFLYVNNKLPCPITFRYFYKAYKDSNGFKRKHIIDPPDSIERRLFAEVRLEHIDSTNINKHLHYIVSLGDADHPSYDTNFIYQYPFLPNKTYRVTQSYGGKFSHKGVFSKYSVDFKMPVGDTVCAARGGVVVKVVSKYIEGKADKEFIGKANMIVVYHSDGTLGQYVHLKHQGAFVSVGDTIEQGEPIGLSGRTGYASGPHLHFSVILQTVRGPISIPTKYYLLKAREPLFSFKYGKEYMEKKRCKK